jgi:hypothetical protein
VHGELVHNSAAENHPSVSLPFFRFNISGAVIAPQGLPCGQVVGTTKQGENDYLESCQDGNRYRVFTNAEGRVIVQKK